MKNDFRKTIEISISNDYLEIIPKDFIDNTLIEYCDHRTCSLQDFLYDFKIVLNETISFCSNTLDTQSIKNICLKALSLSDIILNKINIIRTEFKGCHGYEMFENSLYSMISGNNYFKQYYPKSFLNYSVFQFALEGYPYNTPSGKQYMISNIIPNSKTENVREICISNILSFLQFIQDTRSILISDTLTFEQIIKTAWCIAISLIGLHCESDILNKTDRIIASLQQGDVFIYSNFGVKK